MSDEAIRQGSALRARRRVILLCAPVTMLFTFADTLALQRFSPAVFGVRLLWSALIVAVGLSVGRVPERVERSLMFLLAVSSSLFFGLIAFMTGGFRSPLFHWILAMPLVIAVVLQEFPRATLAAAVATLVSGLAIVIADGQPAAIAIEWGVQAAGMSVLAVYASVAYRRLRFREQALREAAAVAAERARASEAAVRARDEFLSVASHELRTPLTALKLQSERLLRRTSDPALSAGPVREGLDAMHRQIEKLTGLANTMLDVTMLADTRPALHRLDRDLAGIIGPLVERYQPLAKGQGCTLTAELAGPAVANVDPVRFEQITGHLLSNAIKFGHGKPVKLQLTTAAGWARVTVTDQGIGVAAQDQKRIFERFERAASSRNYGGMGLGLWLSRRLLEEMHGSITVDSRPGEGASFTIEVPLSDPEQADTAHREAAGAPAT